MMLLVSGATRTVARLADSAHLGQLMRPGNGNSPGTLPWAADNGAFAGFDADAFIGMLRRFETTPGCMWVTAPDVVGDSRATLDLFDAWEEVIHGHGFPVAFVAQDGLTPREVPWGRCEALFIGGSTEWKLGPVAEACTRVARAAGLRVHMGRVNTIRRMRVAYGWGVDSIDGTQFSMFPDRWLPWALDALAAMHRQEVLPWA